MYFLGGVHGQDDLSYFSWYKEKGDTIYQYDSVAVNLDGSDVKLSSIEAYFLEHIGIKKLKINDSVAFTCAELIQKQNFLYIEISFENPKDLIRHYEKMIQIVEKNIKSYSSIGVYELDTNGYRHSSGKSWSTNYYNGIQENIEVYISFQKLPTISSFLNHSWTAKNNAILWLRSYQFRR